MKDQNDAVNTSTSHRRNWFQHIRDNMHADSLVGAGGIAFTALFLILLTVTLLYSITVQWPLCELPEESKKEESQNSNAATASAGANQSAPPVANTNSSPTPDANANAAAANSNATANAGAAANTNINANARAASPSPSPTGAGGVAAANLDADSIEPTSGPVTGKTLVTIKGENFGSTTKGMVIKFGGREANVTNVDRESISVRTPPHSEGAVDVIVERDGDRKVLRSAYTYTCPAPTGRSLFLMLSMAGALGGCIHAMRSLYWYAGQRELKWSWLPMYYALPFIGSAMAMIFSLLIVAGFVDSTTGRSQSLFIIAVAGLVGMFSQQASLKLTDIANAFFTKPGQGSDAKPQKSVSVNEGETTKPVPLTATAIDKGTGKAAGGDEVTIKGNGFSTSTTVSFGGVTARVKTVSSTSITVVTPHHAAGDVDVEVKSGNQSVKLPAKFNYA